MTDPREESARLDHLQELLARECHEGRHVAEKVRWGPLRTDRSWRCFYCHEPMYEVPEHA